MTALPITNRLKTSERLILAGGIIFAAGLIWSNIFGYLGICLGLIGICIDLNVKMIPPSVKKLIFLIAAFLLWGLFLSLFIAGRKIESLAVVFAYAAHWLFPFALGFWLKDKYRIGLISLFVISITLVGILGLGAYFGLYQNSSLSKEGMIWGLHHHIAFAAMLLMAFQIIYGVAFAPGTSRNLTIALLLAGILIILVLVFAGSRAYWLAGAITIAGAAIYNMRKGHQRILSLAYLGVCVFEVAIIIMAFPQVRGRTTITEPNVRGFTYRKNMAIMALNIIKDHPLSGIGPGQVPFAKEYYARMDSANLRVETGYLQKKHLHNMYLQIGAEFGIPGLLIFLAIIFLSLWIVLRAISTAGPVPYGGIASGVSWVIIALVIGEIFDCLLRGPAVAMMLFWLIGMTAGGLKRND